MSTTELETRPGLIKHARKALVAGLIGFAGSFGPAIATTTADGQVSTGELLPIIVTAVGIGIAAALAVFWTPNAPDPVRTAHPDPEPDGAEAPPAGD